MTPPRLDRNRNQRAAAYQRALAQLRDRHPDEFAALYATERSTPQPSSPTTDDHASR